MARTASTTDRGLGWRHQQQVANLFRQLVDGTLCWWCGLPMFHDTIRNWDRRKLAGDHSRARSVAGPHSLADRLLHATCNERRGDGSHDHERPALTGEAIQASSPSSLGTLVMPWP